MISAVTRPYVQPMGGNNPGTEAIFRGERPCPPRAPYSQDFGLQSFTEG